MLKKYYLFLLIFLLACTVDKKDQNPHKNLQNIPGHEGIFNNSEHSQGHQHKSVKQIKMALEKDPNNTQLAFLLANTYKMQNNYKKAIELYKDILKINPNDSNTRIQLAISIMLESNKPSRALKYLTNLKQNEKAHKLKKLLLKLKKSKKVYSYKTFFFNSHLGNIKFDEGNYIESIKAYTRALKEIPFDPYTRIDMGIAYRRLGNPDRAIKEFKTVLLKNKNHPEALFNLGIVLAYDLHKIKDGLKYWKKLLKYHPYFAGTKNLKLRMLELE